MGRGRSRARATGRTTTRSSSRASNSRSHHQGTSRANTHHQGTSRARFHNQGTSRAKPHHQGTSNTRTKRFKRTLARTSSGAAGSGGYVFGGQGGYGPLDGGYLKDQMEARKAAREEARARALAKRRAAAAREAREAALLEGAKQDRDGAGRGLRVLGTAVGLALGALAVARLVGWLSRGRGAGRGRGRGAAEDEQQQQRLDEEQGAKAQPLLMEVDSVRSVASVPPIMQDRDSLLGSGLGSWRHSSAAAAAAADAAAAAGRVPIGASGFSFVSSVPLCIRLPLHLPLHVGLGGVRALVGARGLPGAARRQGLGRLSTAPPGALESPAAGPDLGLGVGAGFAGEGNVKGSSALARAGQELAGCSRQADGRQSSNGVGVGAGAGRAVPFGSNGGQGAQGCGLRRMVVALPPRELKPSASAHHNGGSTGVVGVKGTVKGTEGAADGVRPEGTGNCTRQGEQDGELEVLVVDLKTLAPQDVDAALEGLLQPAWLGSAAGSGSGVAAGAGSQVNGPDGGQGAKQTEAGTVQSAGKEVQQQQQGQGPEPQHQAVDSGGEAEGDPRVLVLGLDAEWQPEVAPGQKSRISVLQLSTASSCWVLRPGPGPVAPIPASGAANPLGPDVDATADTGFATGAGGAHIPPQPPLLPAGLVALLQDPRVVKAGVGIQEDVRRMERDFGVRVRGAVDVRLVAQWVAGPGCLAGGGSLRALTAALLGRRLDKSEQRSDWGAEQLADTQITYAAHDAWLSRELLLELHRRYNEDRGQQEQRHGSNGHMEQEQQQGGAAGPWPPAITLQAGAAAATPERASGAGAPGTPGVSYPAPAPGADPNVGRSVSSGRQVSVLELVAPFMDTFGGIKTKRVDKALGPAAGAAVAAAAATDAAARLRAAVGNAPSMQGNGGGSSSVSLSGDGSRAGGGGGANGRNKADRKLPTRKSVLYENCRLLAPDGAVLCTCGGKKVRWYLDRGLADVVGEEPLTIQLRFEPRGRGHADDQYYLADKENRCCVCGSEGEYLRHSVVPHCYRQHFPPAMKSHLSHDIVLMCQACHKVSSTLDQRRMEALGRQYGAPLAAAAASRFRRDDGLGAVRSAGRALTNPKVSIPEARRTELLAVVARHVGVASPAEVTEEHVQLAANVDPLTEEEDWRSHAEVVVAALGGRHQALEAFVRGWRQHFLDSMSPRFLPPHWRVDARVANSSAKEDDKDYMAAHGKERGRQGASGAAAKEGS